MLSLPNKYYSLFLFFHFIEQNKYLFYFYATTVNVLMEFMPLVYSHGAYCFFNIFIFFLG